VAEARQEAQVKTLLKIALFLAAFLAALALGHHNATAASLADTGDPRLDAVASGIAGHPVHVYCEDDLAEWAGFYTAALGFTYAPETGNTTVWVHPYVCGFLHKMLDEAASNPPDSNDYPYMGIAQAVHVLTHESVHQIGGQYADCYVVPGDASCEGRTDCRALELDRATAVALGVPATVPQRAERLRAVKVRVRGKVRRVYRRYYVTVRVPNPVLDTLRWHEVQMHDGLPPQYLGPCGHV
jgi:hypothetical protein